MTPTHPATLSDAIFSQFAADAPADSVIGIMVQEVILLMEVPTLNKRECHDCGNVAWHADARTPYVNCRKCGSQDTRLIWRPTA